MIVRAPLHRPFTVREEHVVELVAAGHPNDVIADRLSISPRTVDSHVERAAAKIPGDLPPRARVIVWWRGGAREVLGGA